MRTWRIHGDNIIECYRALRLVASALSGEPVPLPSAAYAPRCVLGGVTPTTEIELLPGYGRWGVDIPTALRNAGASLRELGDALITEVVADQERVVLALEFSSALPAGNNAWQRNGRALAFAQAGVPYLYFADVGGVELNSQRKVKAPRFPNPLVPFSYATATTMYKVLCLPAYQASPSSADWIRTEFADAFGYGEAIDLVATILRGDDTTELIDLLRHRTIRAVQLLSAWRRRRTTLAGGEWELLLGEAGFVSQAHFLSTTQLAARRRATTKVAWSSTYERLAKAINDINCVAPGATDLPIVIIPGKERHQLESALREIYGQSVEPVSNWLADSADPLALVWVTGFKPRGDDSRPDRGLVPLARMLFGPDADILSIIWGPGPANLLALLPNDLTRAMELNGLLESVVGLSSAVIVDSISVAKPHGFIPRISQTPTGNAVAFSAATSTPTAFGEHDVDSVLHALFTSDSNVAFEGMCNPPGGDWSGLSIINIDLDTEYRWTSLPRVSGAGSKRPDHVVQLLALDLILVAESKTHSKGLEAGIGESLKTYTRSLLLTSPTIYRPVGGDWRLSGPDDEFPETVIDTLAVGAFVWRDLVGLTSALETRSLDIAIGVEFDPGEQLALLHIVAAEGLDDVIPEFKKLASGVHGIEVQEH